MTTILTDPAIEVAGRRLNPAVSPEWQHLLTHFELSEGFSFIVLLVPDSDWAEACRIALSRYLEAEGKSLLTVAYKDPEDFKVSLPGRLLELHLSEQTGVVWLSATVSKASPEYEEWVEAWRGMAARLNQFRNPLSRGIKVPLVFVGAHWIQPVIRDTAPDLWSVRTMVTRVEPPSESRAIESKAVELSTEQQLEGLAIDPDFALQAANRLRSEKGKELALAQLLYRAALGLNARSHWLQAEEALREAVALQRKFSAPADTLASSLLALEQSLRWHYKFDEAVRLLEEAKALFVQAGNLLGEATSLVHLGDIAAWRSDYDDASAFFQQASSLYKRVGNTLGEANCAFSVGDLALRRYDNDTALVRFEEALMLYRQSDSLLGQANCILGIGDIALRRSDYDTARVRFEEALTLYRRIGSVLGEANCTARLGEIALGRTDFDTARARFEKALQLYHQIGSVLGEANCMARLGDIQLLKGLQQEAAQYFKEALKLFEEFGDAFSVGWTQVRFARLADNSAERDEHLEAARRAWSNIDRHDLIRTLDEEFEQAEENNATDS